MIFLFVFLLFNAYLTLLDNIEVLNNLLRVMIFFKVSRSDVLVFSEIKFFMKYRAYNKKLL